MQETNAKILKQQITNTNINISQDCKISGRIKAPKK